MVPAKNWSRLRWCVLHRDFVDDEDWKTKETVELVEIAEVIQIGKIWVNCRPILTVEIERNLCRLRTQRRSSKWRKLRALESTNV